MNMATPGNQLEIRTGVGRSLSTSRIAARRIALALAALAAFSVGLSATGDEVAAAATASDPELTLLLRAMTALKAVAALLLIAAVGWRLAVPASGRLLVLYFTVVSIVAAGLGPMWEIANLVAGAAMLHGGLLAGAVLLWRDPAVSQLLSERLQQKRVRRRSN